MRCENVKLARFYETFMHCKELPEGDSVKKEI